MINKTPIYNLNAVLREVGLSADVLRAWERRYQLPVPQRTAGGHRLYSEHDIETIKWLKARQEEGLSISRAVNLWRDIAVTANPLEYLASTLPAASEPDQANTSPIEHFRETWVEACLDYNSIKAEDALNQALSIFTIEKVCVRVLQQGLSEIGEKWYDGSASALQEHFASGLALNRVQAMIAGTPKPLFNKTILIGCPPAELHTFPGLLLTLFLRREGFAVVYLGADVPIEQLAETASQVQPDLVILTAQRLPTAKTLADTASSLTSRNFSVAFGGLIFTKVPDLTTRIAGHYLGDSLEASIEQIKSLTLHSQSMVLPSELSSEMKTLVTEFTEHRPLVEHHLTHILRENALGIPHLTEINAFLGDDLVAALALGNLKFIDQDIHWIKNMRRRVDNSSTLLPLYIHAYNKSVSEELGVIAAPISNWLISTISLINTKENV